MAVIPLNNDWIMQTGIDEKKEVYLDITFEQRFADEPIVTISPVWRGSRSGVGHAETIVSISPNSFRVASNNAAAGSYLVPWIAVGRRRA